MGRHYIGTAGAAGTLTVNGGHVIAMTRNIGQHLEGTAPAVGPGASRTNNGTNGAPGIITVTGGILEAWVDRSAASCFGISRGYGTAATIPDGAGLFVTGGTVKWNHLIKDEVGFAYSFADCNVGCSAGPVLAWAGLWLPVDTDLSTLFPSGVNFEKAANETVAANSLQLVDLASGNLAFDSSTPFTIVGSSASSANKINATGSIEAAICGVNSTGAWAVPADSTSTIHVYGGNQIVTANIAWTLPETGTLSFKGDGWLLCEASSGDNCAIGVGEASKWGTLIVDGPTVQAEACHRSSGVGLSYSYNTSRVGAGKVVVESGTLIATGRGYAPGIGGGSMHAVSPGSVGPEVIVKTNGTIYAYNIVDAAKGAGHPESFAAGVAIGGGVRRDNTAYAADAGTITVDGGTIYASVANSAMPCFGIVNGKKTGVQNSAGTGSLTVKNGGKVFFHHSDFPGQYTVTIDNGTLGTMSDSPTENWVTFNSLATVTNGLTIAGPVEPVLSSFPSFKNYPEFNVDTAVTVSTGMSDGEWVAVDDIGKVTLHPSIMKRTKTIDDRELTRFELREGWVDLSATNAVYDITANGVYKFYGTGASPVAISVAAGVVCTNLLYDASINVDGGTVAPLELGEGSTVFLQLVGSNSLNRIGTNCCAVIRVPYGASLTIADGAEEGETAGSLTIDETNLSNNHVVGIGEAGTDSQMGSLTIDSGTITIRMRHDNNIHGGAAIGSAGQGASCGTVTINGGYVDLDGPGLGPAIGAGTDNTRIGSGGDVTINGGKVIAKGYGGSSAIGLAPTYGSGTPGTPGTFTMNDGLLYAYAKTGGSYGSTQCGAAIGGSGTRGGTTGSTIGQVTFNGGSAYLYSASAYSIGCGLPQNGSEPVARAATDRVTINGGHIWAPQGIQGDVVNTSGDALKEVSIPSSLFTDDPCTLDLDGTATYTFPKTTFSDGLQHLWLPSCLCESVDGLAIVVGDADDETPRSYTMSSGATKVFVAGTTTLSSSSALSGAGVIVLADGSETTFNGLNFSSTSANGYNSAVVVQDGASAKIVLEGSNTLQRIVAAGDSVIHLPAGATLTVDGGSEDWLGIVQNDSSSMMVAMVGIGVGRYTTLSMGTLVLDGGNVAVELNSGIKMIGVPVGVSVNDNNTVVRNAGTVIVNGGSLLAEGGSLSPGIGGGYSYGGKAGNGGTVTVNGGVVTAKGFGGSAAIGGGTAYSGTCGKGGSFTLNGGTVYAYAKNEGTWGDAQCGAAIGGSAERNDNHAGGMGTVTVSNGTLYAYAGLGAAIGHGTKSSGASCTIENGSDGAFTITGGSVKLVSGNSSAVSHVTPTNGEDAVSLVTVPARKFGSAPYSLEFVEKVAEGETPLVYPYNGSGHDGDTNLYFYLPYGKYLVNGLSCVVDETKGFYYDGGTMVIIR